MWKNISTVNTVDSILQIPLSRALKNGFSILYESECYARLCHQHSRYIFADISGFRACAFYKLKARRHVKKQVFNFKSGTIGDTDFALLLHRSATNPQKRSSFFLFCACFKRDVGNCRNGGKRLAAES